MKYVEDDIPLGLYVWKTPEGILCDEDGNVLNIPGERGNRTHMKKIADAAAYYGEPVGEPVFLPGRRQVTDDEHEEQKMRMAWGLNPDPYDVAANVEDMIHKKVQSD